ncbi:MAG TPA: serine hydrolase domain-containing protein [Verrucomicrobiota bacterium]|nr:serine hydrolase domain-containing protein [Verrucomicrobiota bacterium]
MLASTSGLWATDLTIRPAVELQFPAVANQFLQVESSSDLIQWSDAGSWFVRQTNLITQLVGAADSARYFRLAQGEVRNLDAILEGIRTARKVPALGCAIIRSNRIVGFGVTGVRKWDLTEKVTPADVWHHGSLTKSMTATLAALLVEQGKIQWTTKLVDLFPERAAAMHAGWKTVTLELLLANRGGAPEGLGSLWDQLWVQSGTPVEQRLFLFDRLTASAPKNPPGTKYEYSNAGFALAGMMLERVMGRPWEQLITEELFIPLGMTSAGFGVPASPRYVNQPWGHVGAGNTRTPMAPGHDADNPPSIGPAGTVHCSLVDMARYVAFHLAGERGEGGLLLSPASFTKLHQAVPDNQNYALGWVVSDRPWAKGKTMSHSGSNLQWFTNVWIAPNQDWACVVVANWGNDPGAFQATDAVVARMVQEFL